MLRRTFPDLELSKIRYYEEQGLVSPKRSKSKYRLFSPDDVTVLREALTMTAAKMSIADVRAALVAKGLIDAPAVKATRRHAARSENAEGVTIAYVPTAHDGTTTPKQPDLHVVVERPALVDVPSLEPVVPDALTAGELLDYVGVSPRQLNDLQSLGFITPQQRGTKSVFGSRDIAIVQSVAPLLALGCEVKQLVPLKRLIVRELDIFTDVARPMLQAGQAESNEDVRAVADALVRARSALYEAALDDFFKTL